MITRKYVESHSEPQTRDLPKFHHCQAVPGKTRKHMVAMRMDDDELEQFNQLLKDRGVKNLGELVRQLLVN